MRNNLDFKQRGFSLIVVVTIMILLSLIAVGLLSLSSVTVRSANNQTAIREAQANARLALTLALGELQELAGPDQRITATANIAGDETGSFLDAGASPVNDEALDGTSKGLSSVQSGTRFWTGVFSNNDNPDQIFEKTPSASLEGWLVSRPESASQANSGTAITPSNPSYLANPDGTAADSDAGIILVGSNAFGNQTADESNFVVAPVVSINSNERQTGSYAWWIGDEGCKALINGKNQEVGQNDNNLAALSPQRRGWEIVDGIPSYPEASSPEQDSLDRIVTLASSELLFGSKPTALTENESLFHSATTFSQGLHTNVLEGGLKVDLTTALEQDLPSSNSTSTFDNFPSSGNQIIPSDATDTPLELLTWDRLLPFYQRIKETSSDEPLSVGMDGAATSDRGTYTIAPLIAEFRMVLGARVSSNRSGAVRSSACAKVLFVIANPYSRPLEWDGDLEFQFRADTSHINNPDNTTTRLWQHRTETAFFPDDERLSSPGAESAVFNQAVFQISSDTLEPGEARVYTMDAPVIRAFPTANSRIDIPLVEVGSTDLGDFNNCIEMTSTVNRTLPLSLDVRERTNSCLVQLQMRVDDTILSNISGIELNNIDFGSTRKEWTQSVNAPNPLMLYKFQLSYPGVDYQSVLPRGAVNGLRASALRTFADFNLQAADFEAPITSHTPPPYFYQNIDSPDSIGGAAPSTLGQTGFGFTQDLFESPLPWGYSNLTGSRQTVLFAIPEALSSLAQLQHLDLTVDDLRVSVAHQPAYAVGNSYATPFVTRADTEEQRYDYLVTGFNTGTNSERNYYDISYLLNTSLWDRFFFSTLDDSEDVPQNPNQILTGELDANNAESATAAASIVNSGMFNVNSTSISAWKAFLASSRDRIPTSASNKNTFPRSLQQPSEGIDQPSGAEEDSFAGSRVLSDDEVDSLAREIVRQVRLRGPFVSMSHFVNRALAEVSDEPELTRSGALQSALDQTVNIDIEGNNTPFSEIQLPQDRAALAFSRSAPVSDLLLNGGTSSSSPPSNGGSVQDWARSGVDRAYKSLASILADREIATDSSLNDELGFRSTSIPAWVTQADVLQLLGPSMNVRSDTFSIRTCGRAHAANGEVLAVAYAEAVVQRTIDFVDPTNASSDDVNQLTSINQRFGRRFKLVSFRWLSENEI